MSKRYVIRSSYHDVKWHIKELCHANDNEEGKNNAEQ